MKVHVLDHCLKNKKVEIKTIQQFCNATQKVSIKVNYKIAPENKFGKNASRNTEEKFCTSEFSIVLMLFEDDLQGETMKNIKKGITQSACFQVI